jgi:hypothetical protein
MRFRFFIFDHFCLDEGVVAAFPPRTLHRLQPLDVSSFGPFKNVYRGAYNNFVMSDQVMCHGKTDINSLPQSVPEVSNSGERVNIFGSAGFKPLDPQMLPEENLLPSTTTDHDIQSEIRKKTQAIKSPRWSHKMLDRAKPQN